MTVLAWAVALVAVLLTAIASSTLWWMTYAWRSPRSFDTIRRLPRERPSSSFSLIVPCREESEHVMSETIRRLLAQDHPDFEIIISLGHDDLDTIAAARRIARLNPRIGLSINHDERKNKPRQLNTALRDCRNDVVGVIDAESLTAPGLLRRVDATFRTDDADVVQGAVHLMNLRTRWFSLRNCLEYRIWFRSRLHGHAVGGFVPLGGNTVFVRRDLLERVGGWDGDCLAEDCDLGVRLSVLRKRIVCVYEPGLVTQEETPDTVAAFVKQRTRWSLGFMQVTAKGDWRRLPTRGQQLQALWMLSQQYTTAFAGVVAPLAVASAIVGGLPVGVVLLTFLPLLPTGLTLGFELIILHEFGRDMRVRIRLRDYLVLVVSLPFYQVLLAVAALRALAKFVAGDTRWEKTEHAGSHLPAVRMPVEDAA